MEESLDEYSKDLLLASSGFTIGVINCVLPISITILLAGNDTVLTSIMLFSTSTVTLPISILARL